jgi:hypothetical protein
MSRCLLWELGVNDELMTVQPIIAAFDIGQLITVAFVVISIIGGLVNAVKGPQAQQKGQPPRPPRNKGLRDEIDTFLQEANRNKPQNRPAEERVLTVDEIELVDEPKRPERKRPPKKKQRPAPKPAAAPQPAATTTRTPLGSEPKQRSLGSDISHRPQPTSSIQPRASAAPLPSSAASVTQSVSSHLGKFNAGSTLGQQLGAQTTSRRETPADTLRKMLRDPQGARQALILTEILSKPKSLRR